MAKQTFLGRNANRILILAAVLAPLACFGALKAISGNKNDVSDWLPATYPETVELKWFRTHFVADQFVLISWDGCELGQAPDGSQDDPRIAKLAEELLKVTTPESRKSRAKQVPAFKSVTTARSVLKELMSPPTELSAKQARQRLTGGLIGPDGKQTVVMANLTAEAAGNLRASVGRPPNRVTLREFPTSALFKAIRAAGLKDNEVRLGGPPIDNAAIDEEGEKTLARLAGLAGALGVSLAYYSLRSVRMTAIVFMCGILSAALSLAFVPLLGFSMDAVLMSMPALVYVLAVSGAVHVINYYRQALRMGEWEHAVEHAVAHAWRPAILCSVTTAIGLASLLTSEITPIAKFGGFSALGVFGMLIFQFLVLPAAMKKWPWTPPELRGEGALERVREANSHGAVTGARGWISFGNFVRRHHVTVFTGCMLAICVLCAGLPKTTTSIDLLKLFSKDAQLLKDYEWFETKLGRIVPMELVIRFPEAVQRERAPEGMAPGQLADRLTFLERLEMVARVQASIDRQLGPEGEDIVGSTMSAATFAPALGGKGSGVGSNSYRFIANENLSAHRAEFQRAGYWRVEEPVAGEEDRDELWRISVRVAAFHGLDHGVLVDRVKKAVEPVLAAHEASTDAMRALAQRRHGQPNGARVIIWRHGDSTDVTNDVAAFLGSKNVKAVGTSQPIDSLGAAELKSLAAYDGIIMEEGFDRDDYRRLRKAGLPILATLESATHSDPLAGDAVKVVYTGVIPVVYKAQRALLDSLVQSTWWSFATITPLMMWVCRGFAAGAVVMIPNTLPVLVVFGGMGWLGIPVDIGSMMAASIALGVAVDDTIHFLAWFRDDFIALGNRHDAVLSAYGRSATATLQAALINGLGLSVFATSSFTPTQRFGWLMLTILVAGMVAELIMLPSLLFGPLGKVFGKKAIRSAGDSHALAQQPKPVAPLDPPHRMVEHRAAKQT